jgi:hypothetical protein
MKPEEEKRLKQMFQEGAEINEDVATLLNKKLSEMRTDILSGGRRKRRTRKNQLRK